MVDAILLAVCPFVLNGVVALTNYATGFKSTAGKRFLLAVVALCGAAAMSAATGNPIDPNSVSSLVQMSVEAFYAFLASHATYHLFFKPAAQ